MDRKKLNIKTKLEDEILFSGFDRFMIRFINEHYKIYTIEDLIGMKREVILGTHGIGPKKADKLCKALQMHGITVVGGKFALESRRRDEKSIDPMSNAIIVHGGEKVGDTSDKIVQQQLKELFVLTGEVAMLNTKAIGKAIDALKQIITEEKGRGDGING